ncbi:MAG: hypothetical protein KGO03_03460 [Gemmatimonadota bacterium]|nr:hypothetical protein [Gemmatimonadota bacterium]
MQSTLARSVAPLALAFAAIAALSPRPARAQGTTAATDSATLRIFVDHCPCRLDYVRTEIPFVNYVRDRTEADVQVLFTTEPTGSGGRSYTVQFIGLGRFADRVDTMRLSTPLDATEDQRRATIVRYLKLGLVPYLNETRAVSQLDVTYTPPQDGQPESATPATDPWNFWVFRTIVNGAGQSEQSSRIVSGTGSFTADRTTDAWHVRFFARGAYTERHFVLSDTSQLTSYTNGYDGSAFVVKSDGPHFSVGGSASLHSSTVDNQRSALRVAPAAQWSLFPYAEFQQRQLTVTYTLGATAFDYYQTTLYGKSHETLLDHSLLVSYDLTQPWGNFNLSLAGSQYLQHPDKYAVTASGNGNFRLFRGFSLFMAMDASRVNNQLYLPLGAASEQDVLLQLRQLATSYRMSGRLGLSYTFGSIFNNIVNPRLGRTG